MSPGRATLESQCEYCAQAGGALASEAATHIALKCRNAYLLRRSLHQSYPIYHDITRAAAAHKEPERVGSCASAALSSEELVPEGCNIRLGST